MLLLLTSDSQREGEGTLITISSEAVHVWDGDGYFKNSPLEINIFLRGAGTLTPYSPLWKSLASPGVEDRSAIRSTLWFFALPPPPSSGC